MQKKEQALTFKSLFLPLTAKKAMIFIVIIGLVVFFNMLFNGFVWDDKIYIVFYTDIHSFNFFAFLKENLFNGGGQYRPIPTMYFSLLYIIFKNSTFFYHILQLTLHITNALLLFLVFSKFVEKKLAFFLSLIFLVHPMQVESVSYIAATGNPLFFLFGITAFLLSMNNLNWKKLCIISALLLFSLLTKEAGVIFLFIVFLYRFLFKRKQIIPLFLAESVSLLLYSLIRFGIGGVFFSTLPLVPIARLSLVQRLINIPVIIFYYLKTFLFPVDLAIDQQWTINKVNFSNFYLPLIVDLLFVILVTILGTYIYKKYKDEIKIYLFFVAWFIFGMLLYLQIFPLDGTVADRWFYFPIVGLLGILGIGIHLIKSNHKIIKKISYLLIIFLVILFSIRTITRNTNWYDPITLYTNDIKISDNFDIENVIGTEYVGLHEYSNAIEHSKKSVELFPYEANMYNLANAYEWTGNIQESIKYYSLALASKNYISMDHDHFLATYMELSHTLYLAGRYDDAIVIVKRGLGDYPDSGELWKALAMDEYKLGNREKAFSAVTKAKMYLPDDQIDSIYLQIQGK